MTSLGDDVLIRALCRDDWVRFRELRMHALTTERGRFFRSPEEEVALPDGAWRELLDSAERRIFGLFDGETLVGITGVVPWLEDPSAKTAVLVMSYIRPEYRGRGYSRMLFEARLGWILEQERFSRVITSHRASNDVSGRAIRAAGFVETGRKSMTWPDGSVDVEVQYELVL